MVLVNAQYQVTVTAECSPSLEGYPVLYQTEDLHLDDFFTAYFIKDEPAGKQAFQVAVLDLLAASTELCAVLEENILTMLLFRTILRIDLNTRTVVQSKDCENMGGLEEIHSIDGGYLLKGEGDIFRYDQDLRQVWRFCGRDIFVRPTAEKCFWVENSLIHCRDWEGWHYVLDMDKNLISETKECASGN